MSYVRWGNEGSDVYIYANAGGGWNCCACKQCWTIFGLLFHLLKHKICGDCVPGYVFIRIFQDINNFYWINRKYKDEANKIMDKYEKRNGKM